MAMRRTRAAGAVAAAFVVALSLLGTAAFVAPLCARSGSLRGSNGGHELDAKPFRSHVPQLAGEQPRALGWVSFASLVAALGLVAGVTTMPVRAEEAPAAAPVESPEISTYETGGAYAKGGRAKAKRDGLKASIVKKSASSSSSSAGSSGSVFIGSSAPEEGKKKIIFSPADERDEDELSLSRTNRPLLAFLALAPSSIYIVFWALGSVEII
eukprot:CAMPEP_0115422000 /NCGR_PEP_ID=MMETSP0271-20121206/26543_1 /TAXON_ID=71861 /ORGANISM="Scrippsiella trochoidea, Strain CCMP3099" /LENGTH=211 /DNA_ID=CAMNT_0002846663 /DNA_START=21 /DNA_END=656 /DNA_ORIENTATION=+